MTKKNEEAVRDIVIELIGLSSWITCDQSDEQLDQFAADLDGYSRQVKDLVRENNKAKPATIITDAELKHAEHLQNLVGPFFTDLIDRYMGGAEVDSKEFTFTLPTSKKPLGLVKRIDQQTPKQTPKTMAAAK